MSGHKKDLIAFLAGDLDADQAADFDSHLLSCESCWAALQADRRARAALESLREPPPPGLADRVSLAIEIETRAPSRSTRPPTKILAAGLAAAAVLIGALFALVPSRAWSASPAVAAVVHYAKIAPSFQGTVEHQSDLTQLGAPRAVSVGGQLVDLTYYRIGYVEVVVASSPSQFAMPAGGRAVGGSAGMAWSATRSGVTLYCLNGSRPILLAGAVQLQQLQAVAGRLALR